jgi:hypothetical protein
MPQRFKSLVDKFGSNPDAMKQAGVAYATDQIIDLYANGITNVHVYSMNKPDVAEKIMSNLSSILERTATKTPKIGFWWQDRVSLVQILPFYAAIARNQKE